MYSGLASCKFHPLHNLSFFSTGNVQEGPISRPENYSAPSLSQLKTYPWMGRCETKASSSVNVIFLLSSLVECEF